MSDFDVLANQSGKQLKALEKSLEELRSSTAGKTKFAFKRKVKIPVSAETATPPAQVNAPAIPTSTISSASRTISNHSNRYLSRSCLSGPSSSTHHIEASIISISNSILNLLTATNESTLVSANPVSLSALHIRDIQNSILILGTVNGSIMLHNLTNCVVVAGCHQVELYCLCMLCSAVLMTGSSGCTILLPLTPILTLHPIPSSKAVIK